MQNCSGVGIKMATNDYVYEVLVILPLPSFNNKCSGPQKEYTSRFVCLGHFTVNFCVPWSYIRYPYVYIYIHRGTPRYIYIYIYI